MIAYFGYGSLVNLTSLRTPYISAHRARLKGWQRVWLARPAVPGSFAPIENLAFLSMEPKQDAEIEGLLIVDHLESLPSLDEREALYDRVALDRQQLTYIDEDMSPSVQDSFIYVAQQQTAGQGRAQGAQILRSYLDVVLQGYQRQFGQSGPQSFIDTTRNFELSILEDRENPLYPRAVSLSNAEAEDFLTLVPPRD